MALGGSRTETNLRDAFAREARSVLRLLYFARLADVEGESAAAALLRTVAEGETAHALGLLELLSELGDPLTGEPIADTATNLATAALAERGEGADLYPEFARVATEENLPDAAEWFGTLAAAEVRQAARLAGDAGSPGA